MLKNKKFKVWAAGCSHVNADKMHGRESLAEAISQSEKDFDWDIGLNIGDFSSAIGLPSDKEGREIVRQFKALKKHNREDIYTICGNHDRNSPFEPEGMWFRKWIDPMGENMITSNVDKTKYKFPLYGNFERYYFDVGNIRFLMMSDVNEKSQLIGRGELGGNPGGVVTQETFDWWVNQVQENYCQKIIISVHHYMLKDTTVASGDWEGMKKDNDGNWITNYHGFFSKGTPKAASYLYWVGGKTGEGQFENWLKNNPGKVDIWIGGHTHTNPDDTKGGKSHIEKKYGETTFINVAALTRWHVKHHATPLSRILTFEESSEKLSVECFMHSDDYREKGFYDEKKIELKLSKKFKFYSDTE